MSSLDEHHTQAWVVESVTMASAAAKFTGENTTAQCFSCCDRASSSRLGPGSRWLSPRWTTSRPAGYRARSVRITTMGRRQTSQSCWNHSVERPVGATMRAITYDRFGGPDVLELTDLPTPKVGPDSVLVRVRASSLNPVDWKVREGYLAEIMDTVFPVVPGWDVAGVVEQVGLDTPEFQVGDEVFGYVRKDVVGGEVAGGTLPGFVAARVGPLAHRRSNWSFEEAAALPLAGLTALQTIRRAGVQSGNTVLVHAAAGGVTRRWPRRSPLSSTSP